MIQPCDIESIDTDLKAKLPAGPWQTEPDRKEWVDKETGYPCRVIRMSSGALCGYVGLDNTHPLFELRYNDDTPALEGLYKQKENKEVNMDKISILALFCATMETEGQCYKPEILIEVHGGLSFSGYHKDNAENPYWWYGFDCSHSGDRSPVYEFSYDEVYRDFAYTIEECRLLAQQLKTIETTQPKIVVDNKP